MNDFSLLQQLANNSEKNSFSNKRRKIRMLIFEKHFPEVMQNDVIKILDLGGTVNFWQQMGYSDKKNLHITVLNIIRQETDLPNISTVEGDACNLPQFKDNSFDIVFSNSAIEHVGNFEQQKKMANEIMRIGKKSYVQTPNYWFPVEPHFLFIGFQWLPIWLRVFMIMHFRLGWYSKERNKEKARISADSVHLLTRSQLKLLFPGATVLKEKFMGLTKSFIIINPGKVQE